MTKIEEYIGYFAAIAIASAVAAYIFLRELPEEIPTVMPVISVMDTSVLPGMDGAVNGSVTADLGGVATPLLDLPIDIHCGAVLVASGVTDQDGRFSIALPWTSLTMAGISAEGVYPFTATNHEAIIAG